MEQQTMATPQGANRPSRYPSDTPPHRTSRDPENRPDSTSPTASHHLAGSLENVASSPTLISMVEPAFQVTPETTIREVKDVFGSDQPLSAIVVARDDRPLGLVMSIHLDRVLSQQYGVSLYHSKPVHLVMDDSPLIVTADMPVELAAGEAMQRDPASIYDHLIVVEEGKLAGLVSVQEILLTLATLQSQRTSEMVSINSQLAQAKETAEMVNSRLRDAYAKLQEVDRVKTDFLAMVSHELRTPLTSVLGFAEIVQTRFRDAMAPLVDPADKPRSRAVKAIDTNLEVIVQEGTRLTALINDVLDIAKLEAGKMEWRSMRLSMDELLVRAMVSTRSLFIKAGIRLVREVEDDLPDILGDQDRILQVLINLLSNAVKFTPEGTVTMSARRQGDSIRIAVRDTGIGIAPQDLDKVFDKFSQVGDTLTDKPKGTGLGLPICRQIIEAHQGEIGVDSSLGQGSEFWFILPVDGGDIVVPEGLTMIGEALNRPDAMARRMLLSGHGGGKGYVLVVDPDDDTRQAVSRHMARQGYQTKASRSGSSAMKALLKDRPGMLILPAGAPRVGGINFSHFLRRTQATARIPIMTMSVVDHPAAGRLLSLDRYFPSPMNRKDFLGEIRQLPARTADRKTVLVADTDSDRVTAVARALEDVAPSVQTASTWKECLDGMERQPPDIVISGCRFADDNDLVGRIRANGSAGSVNFVFLADADA